jgi:predicted ATPase/DNA-binding SARP family transcriptional activator
VEFRILGPLEVTHEGRSVVVPGSRERAVLVLLLASANRVVPAERLVEELWAGRPPQGAAGALRVFISRLRRALRVAGDGDVVLTKPPGYVVKIDDLALDAARFEALLGEARRLLAREEHEMAAATFRQALALWRGAAFVDAADAAMVQAEAARLEEERLAALEARVEADLACGRHVELVAELEALTRMHPLRERLWGQRMVALYRSGRQADGLRAYQDLRRLLGEELGLEPSPALTHLERAILRQAPELAGRDMPVVIPSGRSLVSHHNLPVALTAFIGRVRELEELRALLAEARLLTLTGVAGAGKTRLALQVATAAVAAYPNGTWMVELAPLRDGAQVPPALAAAIGVETIGLNTPDAVEERLAYHLASRETLLLIDNCEHLVEPVASLIGRLVTHCPGVTVLATSRELLGVPGEVVWNVPPMSLPGPGAASSELPDSDAVRLFCERARAVRPGFQLDSTSAAAVVRICRRLDGIPLALELAAARAQVLSPVQVADRLEDRFRLLTGRERSTVSRHRTLRAAIDWSYDLLSAREQSALAYLSVFPQSFDLEAAEAVMADGAEDEGFIDSLDVLWRLVDKSLVVVLPGEHGSRRYRLLETIRQYGAAKLAEAGEQAAARRRHRDAFITRAEGWRGTILGADYLRGVSVDSENFRVALEWSWAERDAEAILRLLHTQWVPWYWSGSRDGRDWIERVFSNPEFSVPQLADHPGHIDALAARAVFLVGNGDSHQATQLLGKAAEFASRIDNTNRLAMVDGIRGEVELRYGKAADARRYLEAALAGWERLDVLDGVGWCHNHLGWTSVAEADHQSARKHFDRAVELARREPLGAWLAPHALAGLAPLAVRPDEPDRALTMAREAITAAQALGEQPVLAMALARAAETAILASEHSQAIAYLTDLLGVLSESGTSRWLGEGLEMTALVLANQGEAAQGCEILGAYEALREPTDHAHRMLVIGQELDDLRPRLLREVGPTVFVRSEAGGQALSREMAIARAVALLSSASAIRTADNL